METIDVAGLPVANITFDEALEAVAGFARTEGVKIVVTPNGEIAKLAMDDPALGSLLKGADMVLPDGISVVFASRILGTPLKSKVGGADIAAALLPILEREGLSLFFLGGKEGVGTLAAEKLHEKYPRLNICGIKNGYFKDDAEALAAVAQAKPDVLFVCMTAPRQEKFMLENRDKLSCHVALGLGGTIDGFAGTVPRAPMIFRKLYLEWFYRLLKQPSRFGRMLRIPAYLIDITKINKKNKRGISQ